MAEINPNEVYTTQETQELLKISSSTMKRLLKRGLIKANKVGKQYRIMGHEILKAVSPEVDKKATDLYQDIKKKTIKATKDW